MSIESARKFLVLASRNPQWVQSLNSAGSTQELEAMLAEQGLSFTYHEFDEAYSNILTKCQFPAQADELEQVRIWYDMLIEAVRSNNS